MKQKNGPARSKWNWSTREDGPSKYYMALLKAASYPSQSTMPRKRPFLILARKETKSLSSGKEEIFFHLFVERIRRKPNPRNKISSRELRIKAKNKILNTIPSNNNHSRKKKAKM
jgi:hypothetical protein